MYHHYLELFSTNLISFLIFVNQQLTTRGCLILADVFLLLLVLLKIFFPYKKNKTAINQIKQKLGEIAGDDIIATQLDLARAYIEMGEKKQAKEILKEVARQGTAIQKQEAKKLVVACE